MTTFLNKVLKIETKILQNTKGVSNSISTGNFIDISNTLNYVLVLVCRLDLVVGLTPPTYKFEHGYD